MFQSLWMLTTTATLRRTIERPGGLLVSFQELAAYYPAGGSVADFFRPLAPGTRITFTHDLQLVIAQAKLAD